MSKVLSVRMEDAFVEWLDRFGAERCVTRQALLEHALLEFRDDCARGVPELRSSQCSCPVLPDGAAGFSVHCLVHGGRTREEFAEATVDRSALFRSLRSPASVEYGEPS